MFSLTDVATSKVSFSKNLISDQTYNGLVFRLNTAGRAFNVSEGLGTGASATSTVALVAAGGFNDQRITGVVKYVAPTVSGGEDIGVVARFQSIEDNASTTYYYARVVSGNARITKVVGGTFTTLASHAFALEQDTLCTIVLTVQGTAISATFTATGGATTPVNLSAVDSAIPSGGLMGFRSLSSTIYCRSVLAEQL